MILVDTSILGRIASFQSPLHPIAINVVKDFIDRDQELVVAAQSIVGKSPL